MNMESKIVAGRDLIKELNKIFDKREDMYDMFYNDIMYAADGGLCEINRQYGEYSYCVKHTNVNLDDEDMEFMCIYFIYSDPNANTKHEIRYSINASVKLFVSFMKFIADKENHSFKLRVSIADEHTIFYNIVCLDIRDIYWDTKSIKSEEERNAHELDSDKNYPAKPDHVEVCPDKKSTSDESDNHQSEEDTCNRISLYNLTNKWIAIIRNILFCNGDTGKTVMNIAKWSYENYLTKDLFMYDGPSTISYKDEVTHFEYTLELGYNYVFLYYSNPSYPEGNSNIRITRDDFNLIFYKIAVATLAPDFRTFAYSYIKRIIIKNLYYLIDLTESDALNKYITIAGLCADNPIKIKNSLNDWTSFYISKEGYDALRSESKTFVSTDIFRTFLKDFKNRNSDTNAQFYSTDRILKSGRFGGLLYDICMAFITSANKVNPSIDDVIDNTIKYNRTTIYSKTIRLPEDERMYIAITVSHLGAPGLSTEWSRFVLTLNEFSTLYGSILSGSKSSRKKFYNAIRTAYKTNALLFVMKSNAKYICHIVDPKVNPNLMYIIDNNYLAVLSLKQAVKPSSLKFPIDNLDYEDIVIYGDYYWLIGCDRLL